MRLGRPDCQSGIGGQPHCQLGHQEDCRNMTTPLAETSLSLTDCSRSCAASSGINCSVIKFSPRMP